MDIAFDRPVDTEPVPTTFEEFHRVWEPRIRGMAFNHGIKSDDIEDAVQQVFLRLWDDDHLTTWDPERAPFRAWTITKIKWCLARLGQQWAAHNAHEGSLEDDYDKAVVLDDLSKVEEAALVGAALRETYERLSTLPKTETLDFARLFSELVEQAEEDGRSWHSRIAAKHGLARQSVAYQVKCLLDLQPVQKLHETLREAV